MVIYTLVIAGLWQASGLVMALMLAGLRGIDDDLWKAARVDGIPTWRIYLSIVIPMLRPVFVTAIVLLVDAGIVKLYDLVVAMTSGGPGIASEVPAKFVMDHLFERNNIGLALRRLDDDAGHRRLSSLVPWFYAALLPRPRRRRRAIDRRRRARTGRAAAARAHRRRASASTPS